jgi:hypothetical protein
MPTKTVKKNKPTESKELVTTKSDVTHKAAVKPQKEEATPVIVDNEENYIYNRSAKEVTVFVKGVKYIIPAKGRIHK